MHAGEISKNFWMVVRRMRLRLHEHGPPGYPLRGGGVYRPRTSGA